MTEYTAPPGTVCWHCCSAFEGQARPLPTDYDSNKRVYTYVGFFCSWACAKGYNLQENASTYQYGHICNLLSRVMQELRAPECDPAPPRNLLKMFGGTMSIKSFRGGLGECPPAEPVVVPEYRTPSTKPLPPSKRLMQSKPSHGTDTLRYKRSKPLPQQDTTLESYFC